MNETVEMRLSSARDTCLMYMNQAGFPIRDEVAIQLDPKLPFMGYTTEVNGHPLIVVSQIAVDGPLEGLIIHEMGHIYRTETNHPSHDFPLLEKLLQEFTKKHHLSENYQQETLRSIINTIEDLYADDISFQVYEKHPQKTFTKAVFPEFFASWVHQLTENPTSDKDRWSNAESIINAAFAKSNLVRHAIPDPQKIVDQALTKFSSDLPPTLLKKLSFFIDFLTGLPDNPTKKEFTKLMQQYFTEFLFLTK